MWSRKPSSLTFVIVGSMVFWLAACDCVGQATIDQGRGRPDGGSLDGGVVGSGDAGPIVSGAHDSGVQTSFDGGEDVCVATTATATSIKRPMDVILFVDTSASMGPAIDVVRQRLNTDFATVLSQSGIDYRVILLADRDALCIDPPLGGAACSGTGAHTTPTSRLFQFSLGLGSGNGLSSPLATISSADKEGNFASGWSQWLRDSSYKTFLQLTDATSQSDITAQEFDAQLLAMMPSYFGTSEADRRYTYHVIMGVPANTPATDPYQATDPVLGGDCSANGLYGAAQETYQQAAIQSGGLRFSLCDPEHYSVIFQAVAAGVIRNSSVPCELAKPTPTNGQVIDESTVLVKYISGSAAPQRLLQVPDAASCKAGSFYITTTSMVLCPQACSIVQADPNASLRVEYGCKIEIN